MQRGLPVASFNDRVFPRGVEPGSLAPAALTETADYGLRVHKALYNWRDLHMSGTSFRKGNSSVIIRLRILRWFSGCGNRNF